MNYRDIDWNAVWQEGRRQRSWRSKKNKDWNRRAAGFARRNLHSTYVERFLDFLRPEPGWTVLDVGCGPGTLAIPLAAKVKQVTAVDFAPRMLEELAAEARRAGVANLVPVEAAWEDDWEAKGIAPHDLAIASRSLSVDDLKAALEKLDAWARRRVVVSDRVGSGPFDPDLFAAVGRPFEPGPDYIVTVNLLYQMGIHARIDFLELERDRFYTSREEAVDACVWMVDDLSPEEERGLAQYLAERLSRLPDGRWRLTRRQPPTWALIWWDKP